MTTTRLAVLALALPVASAAQMRAVLPLTATPGARVAPMPTILPQTPAFAPALAAPGLLTPALAAIPAAPAVVPFAAAPALAAPAAAAPALALLAPAAQALAAAKPAEQAPALAALFDASRPAASAAFDRPTDPWEDARIGRAVETLSRSGIGASIYRTVYRDYGANLRILVDDAPGASYDARLSWEDGRPVLRLTEALLGRDSAVIGAYMTRELADLYYRNFPASAERGYLSYAAMLQTFAETARAWEPDLERYFLSWKDAVKNHYYRRYRRLEDSPFFRDFLMTVDDSNTDAASKLTIAEQYRRRMMTLGEYHTNESYIRGLHQSHADWLNNKGYWN